MSVMVNLKSIDSDHQDLARYLSFVMSTQNLVDELRNVRDAIKVDFGDDAYHASWIDTLANDFEAWVKNFIPTSD